MVVPAVIPLLAKGFILTDDGNWMVIRFSAFYETLKAGQFPVRYLFRLNNSLGYPVADFLYPLFMYIGVPIHVLGFNFVNTIKLIFAGTFLFSGVFSFLWLRKHFSHLPSILGSLVYVYFPYHVFDLYKRGSIGELLALAILPFVFWQIERKSVFWLPVGIALLILSHNSLAFIFLPVILGYMFVSKLSFKTIFYTISLGLFLSAFFWIPAIYDKQFTVFDKIEVSDFSRYFLSDLSLIGAIFIFLIAGSLFSLLRSKSDAKFLYFLTVTVVAVLLSVSWSFFFWDISPLKNYIQFPFRFLSVVCLSSSYLVVYQTNLIKTKLKYFVFSLYIILIAFSSYSLIKTIPQDYPDSFYSTNQDSTTVKNEYMPKWVKTASKFPTEKVTVLKGDQKISNLSTNGNNISFDFRSAKSSKVRLNMVYFPGWVIKDNGKSVPINISSEGLMEFALSPGSHKINAYFGETRIRLMADFLSLATLGIIFIFAIKRIIK